MVWGIGLRRLGSGCGRRLVTGSCVIRETTQTGCRRSRPRVSLSIYLSTNLQNSFYILMPAGRAAQVATEGLTLPMQAHDRPNQVLHRRVDTQGRRCSSEPLRSGHHQHRDVCRRDKLRSDVDLAGVPKKARAVGWSSVSPCATRSLASASAGSGLGGAARLGDAGLGDGVSEHPRQHKPAPLPAPVAHALTGKPSDVHAPGAKCEQLSSKAHGQSPIGSEGGAPGQGYLCFILPASFLGLFLILARRGYMVRRNLIFGLLALAHGVAANRALQLPSPPSSPSRGGRRLSGPACAPNASNASNSSSPNGRMVECTEFVVDGSNASNRSHLSNASNASSPHALQPSPPSPPPHPPCGCQHISVTGAESVQSKRMGIYTRTDDFVGARQLYQRGSPASQYLYYDTRCACSTSSLM